MIFILSNTLNYIVNRIVSYAIRYFRHFIKINENITTSFDEVPFIELSKTHIVRQFNIVNDNGTTEISQEK